MRLILLSSFLMVALVGASLTGCDSGNTAPPIPDPTATANQVVPPPSSGGRTPGTGPMSVGGAQWSEGKALAASLVRNIKTASLMDGIPQAVQVGSTADDFCGAIGIPVPKGQWFTGSDFRVTAVNHSARTFTIAVTHGTLPGTMTVDQNGRRTGP